MLDIFSKAVIGFLAILGLADLCRLLVFWLFQSPERQKRTMVMAIKGHDEAAEYKIRSAAEQIHWRTQGDAREVLCVDCGMDAQTREICEKLTEAYPAVRLCNQEEVPNLLEQEFANT